MMELHMGLHQQQVKMEQQLPIKMQKETIH